MLHYPKKVKVNDKIYPINTDYRIALRCENIARSEVSQFEKVCAIIYVLFGEDALNDIDNRTALFEKAIFYLKCGKDVNKSEGTEEPSMDFDQDIGYIKASFMSDYKMNIDEDEIHWWLFCDLITGLSNKCILNRVRAIREEPLNDKKGKELDDLVKAKKKVALKKENKLTDKQQESVDKFYKLTGIKR